MNAQEGDTHLVPDVDSVKHRIENNPTDSEIRVSTVAPDAKINNELGAFSVWSGHDTASGVADMVHRVRLEDHSYATAAEKQKAVAAALKLDNTSDPEEGCIFADKDYMEECVLYSRGQRDSDPGPFRFTGKPSSRISRPCADAPTAVLGGSITRVEARRLGGLVQTSADGGPAVRLAVNYIDMVNGNEKRMGWCKPNSRIKDTVKVRYSRELLRAQDAEGNQIDIDGTVESWWRTAPTGLHEKELQIWLK